MSAKSTSGEYNGKDMYMVSPIMDIARIKKLPKKNISVINNDDSLKINENLRYRKEKFGWVVHVFSNIEFCTDEGYSFICKLKEKSFFSINSLMDDFNLPENIIKPVINRFVSNKLVLKIN